MRRKEIQEMKKIMGLAISIMVFLVASAPSQTTNSTPVTNNNDGSLGTVPAYSGTASLSNSPISVNGYKVGIGTNSPSYQFDIRSATSADGGFAVSGNLGGATSNLTPLQNTGKTLLGWNWSSGQGESDLISNKGASVGTGGFRFYDYANDGTLTLLMSMLANGDVGIGTTAPGAKLEVNGGLRFTSDPSGTVQTTAWTGVLCGGDYAEAVNASGGKKRYEPGDVLVLASDDKGDVQKSSEPYSTMVAGIYATKPGVIGRRQNLVRDSDDVPMAMIGIVPTKVSAENGPIHKGDLLVTSSTPGFAMKGTDRSRLVGAVIGKAMGSLNSGNGVIQVLVTLQ